MIRPLKCLMISVVGIWIAATLSAQVPGWRYERLGLPPATGDVRVLNGVYHSDVYGRTSLFDPDMNVWNDADIQLGTLRYWTLHASGVGIMQQGGDVLRYHVKDRAISTRSGLYYQFEHDDSIVCAFNFKFDNSASSYISTASWYGWAQNDTLRTDTVKINDAMYSDVIACADSTALVLGQSSVIRYRYRNMPEVVPLPDTIRSTRRHVFIDKERTHILVAGTRSLLYSADQGRSWSSLFSNEWAAIGAFSATDDPDEILVVLDSVLIRYQVSTDRRDTLHVTSRWASRMIVDHGPHGTIIAYPDTVLLIDDASGSKTTIHSGLPERSLVDLISVSDGVAGAGYSEVLHHPSLGQWSTPDVDRRWLNIDPYGSPMIFRGGQDLNDLWLTRGSWALRIHPGDFVFTAEYLLMPEAGCWWNEDVSRFTVITNIEGFASSHQVTWWSGSSPDNILLQKNGLRFLIGFDDSVLVAFGQQGTIWRTINASHTDWEEINMPVVDLGFQPRSQSKGRHGVVIGPRMKAWTHDAGRTWQVDSLPLRELVTLTNNGVLYHVWVDDQNGSEYALVIDKQVGGMRTVVAALPHEMFDTRRNSLNAIAYDDNEHRLYIATHHWVGSLAMDPVSVHEEELVTSPKTRMPSGTYDIFGRYLGRDLPSNAATGCYIVVDDNGEARLVVY
jgi:hypothetical protein